jgi:hypothetical protein
MDETEILLGLRPEDAILRMVNRANDVRFWPGAFDYGQPAQVSGRATSIRLSARPPVSSLDDQKVTGTIDFTYNRLNLATHFASVLDGLTVTLPTSTQVILNILTERMGQDFYLEDIVLEEITRGNAANYLIKAKTESLRWMGQLEVSLITLIDLPTLVASGLPTVSPQLGTLAQDPVHFAPEVAIPAINGTAYRDELKALTAGERVQDHLDILTLVNDIVPPPSHRIEENLDPWVVNNGPAAFNLQNATVLGVKAQAPLSINKVSPLLNTALVLSLDQSQITNFAGGKLTIPFYNGTFEDSDFTDKPRLTQVGIVSMTDASAFATFMNQFKLGDIITDLNVAGDFEIEPGVVWVADPVTPSRTNLYNAVVQYNGQKRGQDITPAHQGLDRVMVVSFSEYNTAYRGNMAIFYTSPIQLPLTIPTGTVGSAYSFQFVPNGGVAPYSFAITSGAVEGATTLDPVTGLLTGIPATGGTYQFTLTVTDAAGLVVPFNYTYTVGTVINQLQLTGTLAAGRVGVAYTGFININGGQAPYTNPRVVGGSLPDNIALAIVGTSLRFSGNWPAADTFNFTVAVDSADGQTAQNTQQVLVSQGLLLTGAPTTVTAGTAYTYDYQITGGVPPYTNPRLSAGNLPTGFSLQVVGSALRLTGDTTTVAGVSSFTVAVSSSDGQSASRASSLVVNEAQITPPDPVVLIGALPAGKINTAYAAALSVTGGNGTYSNLRVNQGMLPDGLSATLSGGTVHIAGEPTIAFNGQIGLAVDSGTVQGSTVQPLVIVDAAVQQYQHWKYMLTSLSDTTDWSPLHADDSSWLEGATPFGNADDFVDGVLSEPTAFDPRFQDTIATRIPLNQRLWIRRTFVIDEMPEAGFKLTGYMDNSFVLYVNGVQVVTGQTTSGVGTTAVIPARYFVVGTNIIAARCDDDAFSGHPDACYFDFLFDGYTFDEAVSVDMPFDGSDGSTSFLDNKGTVWTAHGNAMISNGKALTSNGVAGYFDGSGDYLQASSPQGANFGSTDFTVETYAWVNSASAVGMIMGVYSDADGRSWMMGVNTDQGRPNLITSWALNRSGYDPSRDLSINNKFLLKTWVHLVMQRYGSTLMVFVNGVLVASYNMGTDTLADTTGSIFKIGGNSQGQYFNGYLKNLRITRGVARYPTNFTPPLLPSLPAPVANVPFSGANGSILFPDTAGAIWTRNGSVAITNAFVDGNGDGVGAQFGLTDQDYLTTASTDAWNFGNGDFTLECYLRLTSAVTASYAAIVSKHQTNDVSRGGLSFLFGLANGKLDITLYNPSTSKELTLTTAFPVGVRTKIAAQRWADTLYLLVNDVVVGTLDVTGLTLGFTNGNPIYLGHVMRAEGVEPGLALPGVIEKLKVYAAAKYGDNGTLRFLT